MKILPDRTKSSHCKGKDQWTLRWRERNWIKWSTEKNKHIRKKTVIGPSDLWDNVKWSKLHLIAVLGHKEWETISKQIMTENFPELINSISPQILKFQWTQQS